MFQACFPWWQVQGKRSEKDFRFATKPFEKNIPLGVLSSEQCSEKDLIYDRSVMKTTLIEDYGLVCEKAGLRSKEIHISYNFLAMQHDPHRTIYNSIYMLGMLFGSYIFGWISDRFGRWPTFISGIFRKRGWTEIILICLGWRLWCYQQLQFLWVVSLGKFLLLYAPI